MDTKEKKQALRRTMRDAVRDIPKEQRFRMDMALHRNLLEHPWLHEADTILSYCSTREEPDTHWIIGWGLGNGKTVALPVCLEDGVMEFCRLCDTSELRAGKYGILEPVGRDPVTITEKTLCIVPGFAFTPDGKRLGKGGGYYDRFLAAHPGLRTIGLSYAQLLQAELPCEIHDIGVDAVITDRMK